MLLKLSAVAKITMFLSVVLCASHHIPAQDAQNANRPNHDLKKLFETRPIDFIKTLTEDELKEITNGHRYLLRSLSPIDLEIMQVETCGYAIYNGEFMNPSTINAASKECVENFIPRIPAGISPYTVAIIPVNWFKLAGDKLLTTILSADPSNMQHFSKNVTEYIGTNPDGLCRKIHAESLVKLPIDLKNLLKPECLAEITNISQTSLYLQELHENIPSSYSGSLSKVDGNQVANSREETEKKEFFWNSMRINKLFLTSDLTSGNATNIQSVKSSTIFSHQDISAVDIKDIQSSAISFPEHPNALSVNVPIVKTKRGEPREDLNNKAADEEEETKENKKVENRVPLKEGDFVMQPKGYIGTGPFVVVMIISNNKIVISDCKTGKYKRQMNPNSLRKCEEHEIIPCPVFKVKDKVVVQCENNKPVGPFIIAAVDDVENLYFLTEPGLNFMTSYFLAPWRLLRHYDVNESNEYLQGKLEGELRDFKAGDRILVPKNRTLRDDIEIEVQTSFGLRSDGTIAVKSIDGQIFNRHFTRFLRLRESK